MKIHAIQTGTVAITTAWREGIGHGRRRLLNTILDSKWTEPLPIYAFAIEHPEGVIVVDTGESARASLPGYFPRWHPVFRFATALGEASFVVGGVDLAARLERTTRPEEERLENPFRTARPLADFNILGITRWDAATIAASAPRSLGRTGVRVTPFAEAALLRPKQVRRPSAFVPEEFYGASRIWNLSLGMRVAVGQMHRRMGRYGAAPDPGTHSH